MLRLSGSRSSARRVQSRALSRSPRCSERISAPSERRPVRRIARYRPFGTFKCQLRYSTKGLGVAGRLVAGREHQRVVPVGFHQGTGFLEEWNRVRNAPIAKQHSRNLAIHLPGVGVELQGCANLFFRFFLLPFFLEEPSLDCMRLRQVGIDLQRPLRGAKCIFIPAMDELQLELSQRHQCPGLRIIGVEQCRLVAKPNDSFLTPGNSRPCRRSTAAAPSGRGCMPRRSMFRGSRSPFLRGQQLDLQRIDDRFRDLILNLENIREVSIEARRPHVIALRAINQLRGDPRRAVPAFRTLPSSTCVTPSFCATSFTSRLRP